MTINHGTWPFSEHLPVRTRATANITPFTYYDGLTYLEILSELRKWLHDVLVPHINVSLEEFTEEVDRLIDFVNAKIDEFDTAIADAEAAAAAAAVSVNEAEAAQAAAEVAQAAAEAARTAALTAVDEAVSILAEINTAVIDQTQPMLASEYSFSQFPTQTSETVSINTRAYSVSSVATFSNGNYVAVWYDENRHPRVGMHYASSGAWDVSNVFNVYGNPLAAPAIADGHNSLVVAIDGEGYVHVMGNMHANAMRYVRSAVPFSVTSGWVTMDAAIWPDSVSYPWLRRHGSGDLLAFYREGQSNSSAWLLRRYSVTNKTWGSSVNIMEGRYTTPERGGYPNSLVLDGDTLHLFWMWRGDFSATSNRDFSYLRSDNLGVSWQRIDGTSQTMPVTPTTEPPRIVSGLTGFLNQSGAAAVNGEPHATTRETSDGSAHVRWIRRVDGAWENTVIDSGVAGSIGRPVLASSGNVLVALYRKGDQSLIQQLLPERSTPTPLYQMPTGTAEAAWEGAFDAGALDAHGILRITVSSVSGGASNSTNVEPSNGGWGGILDLRLTQPVLDRLFSKRSAPAVPAPVAMDPSPVTTERVVPAWNMPGMTSQIRPWYAIGGSSRLTTDAPRQHEGRFYGSRCMFPKQARINEAAVRVVSGDVGAKIQLVVVELGATGRTVKVRRTERVSAETDGEVVTIPTSNLTVHPDRIYIVGIHVHGGNLGVTLLASEDHDPYMSWDVPEGFLSENINKFPGYRETPHSGSGPYDETIGNLQPAPFTPIVAIRFGESV